MFHFAAPLAAYATLAASAFAVVSYSGEALFGIGAATLLLLFIGIHNAWDNVAYHVFVNMRKAQGASRQDETSEKDKP